MVFGVLFAFLFGVHHTACCLNIYWKEVPDLQSMLFHKRKTGTPMGWRGIPQEPWPE